MKRLLICLGILFFFSCLTAVGIYAEYTYEQGERECR